MASITICWSGSENSLTDDPYFPYERRLVDKCPKTASVVHMQGARPDGVAAPRLGEGNAADGPQWRFLGLPVISFVEGLAKPARDRVQGR